MRVYSKFGSENLPHHYSHVDSLLPSVLYALAAPFLVLGLIFSLLTSKLTGNVLTLL
jgi:hypothetical protein